MERVSDVFPPLKSVAAGLCAILDNCEVRATAILMALMLTAPQKMIVNKQAIESLVYRSETLVDLLCEPVSGGDGKEETRRKDLEL